MFTKSLMSAIIHLNEFLSNLESKLKYLWEFLMFESAGKSKFLIVQKFYRKYSKSEPVSQFASFLNV
jgi:hypothetical protein